MIWKMKVNFDGPMEPINNQITTAMKIVLISENWDCGMTIIVLIIMDSFAKKG